MFEKTMLNKTMFKIPQESGGGFTLWKERKFEVDESYGSPGKIIPGLTPIDACLRIGKIKITDVNELGDVMISQLSGLFQTKHKFHGFVNHFIDEKRGIQT